MGKMNPLALWRLKQFCEQHELDVQEIDNTLSYAENKHHLQGFIMRTPEKLAEVYGKSPFIEQASKNLLKKPTTIKKKWIPFPSKQQWITISKTHIVNVTSRGN